jgi:hypothetical protein
MDHSTLPREARQTLLRHVFATYNSLRLGMAVISFAFPLVLVVVGWWHGLPLQGSMSAYYWASIEGDPPARVWFVGGLFAIGSFLFLYKGYTRLEDWALNFAALFAIGVALFPMSWNCGSDCPNPNPHAEFAIAFFVCIAYVAFFESRRTLRDVQDQAFARRYRNLYWLTTALMILSPVAAIIAHTVFQKYHALTYFIELFGIWAFALFWLIKSWELRESQAEEQTLDEASEAVRA